MKKLLFVLITALLVACGGGKSEVGRWQMESVSGEELSESEKSAIFNLEDGGAFSMERGGETRKGTWKWSEDKKNIVLTRDGGNEEVMENVKVEGDKMTFSADGDVITLKRL
jgi:hypothetical protein